MLIILILMTVILCVVSTLMNYGGTTLIELMILLSLTCIFVALAITYMLLLGLGPCEAFSLFCNEQGII